MEPTEVRRPWMPGYGIAAGDEGMLDWAWAVDQLTASRHFWTATTWPDGRPHVSPVWGVWLGDAAWFSCGGRSRKALNLSADPRCELTAEDPLNPVVVSGRAEIVLSGDEIGRFLDALNAKYDVAYDRSFLEPDINWTVRVRPTSVIALRTDDFTGSPTRWTF